MLGKKDQQEKAYKKMENNRGQTEEFSSDTRFFQDKSAQSIFRWRWSALLFQSNRD